MGPLRVIFEEKHPFGNQIPLYFSKHLFGVILNFCYTDINECNGSLCVNFIIFLLTVCTFILKGQ